mgnify:CR=1 FL=1
MGRSYNYENKDKSSKQKTKAFEDKFKGHDIFAVWAVNEKGEKEGELPIIAMGKTKAEALAEHMEELESYVKAR